MALRATYFLSVIYGDPVILVYPVTVAEKNLFELIFLNNLLLSKPSSHLILQVLIIFYDISDDLVINLIFI